MTSREERAESRRRSASFLATNADQNVVASRGSVAEPVPSNEIERGDAILRLFELCSGLDPRFDLPMDKNTAVVRRAK